MNGRDAALLIIRRACADLFSGCIDLATLENISRRAVTSISGVEKMKAQNGNNWHAVIAPAHSLARGADRQAEYIRLAFVAVNYSTAVATASQLAAEYSQERGREYGVINLTVGG